MKSLYTTVACIIIVAFLIGCGTSPAKQLHAGSAVFTAALTAEHVAYTLGDISKADIAAALPAEQSIDAAFTQGQAAALAGNQSGAKIYLDAAITAAKQYLATMMPKAIAKQSASLAAWQVTLMAFQAFVDSVVPAPVAATPTTKPSP